MEKYQQYYRIRKIDYFPSFILSQIYPELNSWQKTFDCLLNIIFFSKNLSDFFSFQKIKCPKVVYVRIYLHYFGTLASIVALADSPFHIVLVTWLASLSERFYILMPCTQNVVLVVQWFLNQVRIFFARDYEFRTQWC